MIRNIKKIINLRSNFDFKFDYPKVLKKNLIKKLDYLKTTIGSRDKISLNKIKDLNFKIKINPKEKFKQKKVEQETKFYDVVEESNINKQTEVNFKTNISKISENKFLKKKLQRKLGRLKRKIKRYKFTEQINNDNNQVQMMQNQDNSRLDEINAKIKNLQSELGKLQLEDNLNIDQSNVKKLRNKYKKKIKKLRNKINKLSKTQNVKNNIVELKSKTTSTQLFESYEKTDEIKKNENLLQNKNDETTNKHHFEKEKEEYISELKNQIENYKQQNEKLSLQLTNYEEQDKNNEQIKFTELEQKIKYYQDENLRLSNLVVSNEKTIEIMRNQIAGFENLKQKLYEQVNSLGDTLINNDNIENIFDNKKVDSLQNEHLQQEELKVANSNENAQILENTISANSSNQTKKKDYSLKELDAAIKNIFEN